MNLKDYQTKRRLEESGEPEAKKGKRRSKELCFVVQKHDASHLHYDFRLEAEGVLKSWAVPKGPSMDPSVKRLAIQVEDHPYDYRTFEGVIPSGYGAGTVMIWDEGTYTVEGLTGVEAEKLLVKGLKKGEVHFSLQGSKLKGEFSLVQLKDKVRQWLLIKKNDTYSSKEDITKKACSVVTQRTLSEISGMSHKMPHLIKPMLATLIEEPFDSEEWLFEIKWDGYRAIAELNGSAVELYSRTFQSYKTKFASVVQALEALKLQAIFDGEIVVLDKNGHSNFQKLQNNSSPEETYYYVFDMLYSAGKDLTHLPLVERKRLLKTALKGTSRIRYTEHVEANGEAFFKICLEKGLEGIIGKKIESRYIPGLRSKEWVKIKADLRQEVVICGFTEPKGSRKHFGSLIIGVYEDTGELKFSGHVGGGFNETKLEDVIALLKPLVAFKCPFKIIPKTNAPVTWVKPKLLCEVKFKEWTVEGSMRQPIFMGMRSDKQPKQVKQEKAMKVIKYDFLSHLDKLYWEKEKISKGDLITYYEAIGGYMLPYLVDRPESLRRFPHGIDKPGFFQKNLETHPDWIETVAVEHSAKEVHYLLIQNLESLLYAVNLGCIEIHPWFSRHQTLEYPDFLVLDLDPEDIDFEAVIETALVLHEILEQVKVPNYCKTSGSRGIHICVPLGAQYTYEQAKHFAQLIAVFANQKLPKITSLERSPKNRQKRVYIDCLQNNFGQTLAAPYSVRAKPGALVSTPLEWKEVKTGLSPSAFDIFNMPERLKKRGDLFEGVLKKGINLEAVLKRIQS